MNYSHELLNIANEILMPASKYVYGLPYYDQKSDLKDIYSHIHADILPRGRPREILHGTLEIAHQLIHQTNVETANGRENTKAGEEDNEASLIENLTGAWLVLYFLGMPFIHPWEAALRLVERRGFPRGAAIYKAAGDVYRNSRREFRRSGTGSEAFPVLTVLDHNPLAIDYLKASPRANAFELLAACYELLQLRLYVREGGPIDHCVTVTSLKKLLLRTPEVKVKGLLKMIELVYPSDIDRTDIAYRRERKRQRVCIMDTNAELDSMPACVLGSLTGVFRVRYSSIDPGTRKILESIGGNFLTKSQLFQYKERLSGADKKSPEDYDTPMKFEKFCISLARNVAGSPATTNSNSITEDE